MLTCLLKNQSHQWKQRFQKILSAYTFYDPFISFIATYYIQFWKQGPTYKKGGQDPNKGSNQL